MPDNVSITPGSGDTIAAELISGAKLQRIKLAIGVVDTDNGDISASNPMPVSGTFWQTTQPVSASSLPLPTGASTEATLLAAKLDLDQFVFAATRLLVDGSGVTQPVSGTFWQATQPI